MISPIRFGSVTLTLQKDSKAVSFANKAQTISEESIPSLTQKHLGQSFYSNTKFEVTHGEGTLTVKSTGGGVDIKISKLLKAIFQAANFSVGHGLSSDIKLTKNEYDHLKKGTQ